MLTKRQLRNSNRRWKRKMLSVKVRSLEGIAHELARKAERRAAQLIIQRVFIAALVVWIVYLLEAAR